MYIGCFDYNFRKKDHLDRKPKQEFGQNVLSGHS